MRAGRVVLRGLGSVATLLALGLLAGGGALLWLHETKRDAEGFYTSEVTRFQTTSYALTAEGVEVADVPDWLFESGRLGGGRVPGPGPPPGAGGAPRGG